MINKQRGKKRIQGAKTNTRTFKKTWKSTNVEVC